jgi:4-amino-4-deoxy-L-arabinose transferase-like glycosyltransferase
LASFCLADSIFDSRAGLAAATLFAFSEVGISSTYTAWAQLLLPGFFVMTVFCLWEWRKQEKGIYLAAAGILATAAFMTHFSALLLYPAMLLFAVMTGAKWQWRWLILGAIVVVMMFLPYMLFEIERDFVDLKAFVTQEPLLAPEIIAEYEIYKSGYTAPQAESSPESASATSVTRSEPLPRWRRVINYGLSTPLLYINALNLAFPLRQAAFESFPSVFQSIFKLFATLPLLLFWTSCLIAIFQFVREMRRKTEAIQEVSTNSLKTRLASFQASLVETLFGHVLLLLAFLSLIILLMILTRTIGNDTYLAGFSSIQIVMASYIVYLLPKKKWAVLATILVLMAYATMQSSERFLRLKEHDDTVFSPYNVSIYRHIEGAVDYIAEDWQGGRDLTISYDILPEMSNLWWTPAWHSIDPWYRMGMNFDFLLAYHHGLSNRNTDPIGKLDNADYIIIYSPALDRYKLEDYEIETFGAIVVMKAEA